MKNRTQKIDWNKPLETRNGCPAKLIHTKKDSSSFPRVCVVTDSGGTECVCSFTEEGDNICHTVDSSLDLVNRQNVGWVNLYSADGLIQFNGIALSSEVYATREEADKGAGEGRIGCSEVRWP